MSQKQKVIGITTMLVIYFVIALIGFYLIFLFQNKPKQEVAQSAPRPTIVTPMPPHFKTYESPKQKFIVSYPDKMALKEKSYGMGVNTVELRSNDNSDTTQAPDVQILTIPKALALAIGQSFDSYYQMAENSSKVISSQLKGAQGNEKFTKVKNREINGQRAVEYSSVPTPNPDKQEAEIGVFIESGNEMIMFATGEGQREQLEKILSTYMVPAE